MFNPSRIIRHSAPSSISMEVFMAQIPGCLEIAKTQPVKAWAEIFNLLNEAGLITEKRVIPSQIMVHPMNRSGLGLNPHHVHSLGASMIKMGGCWSSIDQCVCFEMNDDQKREALKFNTGLADNAHGMLPRPNGFEQYASISGSHTSAFFRALASGCITPEEKLKNSAGKLTPALVASDATLHEMMCDGWEWLVISADASEAVPELPGILATALNAKNHVAAEAGEFEIAMRISSMLSKHTELTGQQKKDLLDQCLVDSPKCSGYAMDILEYIRLYGGDDCQLIKFLANFQKSHCKGAVLGGDFWAGVRCLDFKDIKNNYVFLRSLGFKYYKLMLFIYVW